MAAAKSVRSIERAIDILLSFSSKRPTLSVGEIEKLLGLARPTLYRLLDTLEKKGLVRSAGDPRRYQLGHKVVEMANLWLSDAVIVRVSQPYLEALWISTNETVALMIPLLPTRRLCVIEFKSRQALSFSYGIGHTGVMYLGSSGKVILAHMPAEQIEAVIEEGVAQAKISPTKLREQLERIRRDGYAVSEGEITVGAVAISAPVFDSSGAVAGAVGLYGPHARLTKPGRREQIEKVREVAAQISAALGYPRSRKPSPARPPATEVA